MRTGVIALAIVAMASVAWAAEQGPATKPADFLVGEMRVQTMPVVTYLYGSKQTTFAKIREAIGELTGGLEKAIQDGKFKYIGPPIFTYTGVQQDMSAPFTLEVGFPVAEGTQAFGEYKVKNLPALKCATALFSGGITNVGKAWEKLFPAVFGAGLQPTMDVREMYLYWEGENSPNNVVHLELGVK